MDLKDELSRFIFTSKYARYREVDQRRETWSEAVSRLEAMHLKKFARLSDADKQEIRSAFNFVKEQKAVPSMRSLQFGGKAIEAHEARMFNCAVRHVDSLRAFSEIFYLLLCGNGVGIGVSKKFLKRLPDLVNDSNKTGIVLPYTVEDTIEGWSDSVEALLGCYFRNTPYTGRKIVFDYSRIRKKGAPLKTGGGKAPGYRGLKNAHLHIKNILDTIIEKNHQVRLSSINAYDILMHCADAVLSGGVRRSATSVIFDWDDANMVEAKTFFSVKKKKQFELNKETNKYEGFVVIDDPAYPSSDYISVEIDEWEYEKIKNEKKISWFAVYPHRARSNNSVLLLRGRVKYEEYETIFNRTKQFGEPGFVFADHPDTLYNPCFEIGFIPVTEDNITGVQFCNLTSINGAKISSPEDFYEAAKVAALIGTLQAAYTHYPYLSNSSKELTEDEALLGVSITGMMNHPEILLNPEYQKIAARHAVTTNIKWAAKLGIKEAARVTCIKPEGTGSIVLKAASGIHPEHADRYLRRVQVNKLDPVYKHFKKINPHMCEESVWSANKTDDVIAFPIEATPNGMLKKDLDAIKHLDIVKSTQLNWVNAGVTEANDKPVSHNVSCTIIVGETEWDDVARYLYDNRSSFSAVSFLAKTGDKDFKQAPLEAVVTTEDEYRWNMLMKDYTTVDYMLLVEEDDRTELQQELVCAGGQCELPMLSN
jgi:ribonucleoside-diphosphate reductase alpha chain